MYDPLLKAFQVKNTNESPRKTLTSSINEQSIAYDGKISHQGKLSIPNTLEQKIGYHIEKNGVADILSR